MCLSFSPDLSRPATPTRRFPSRDASAQLRCNQSIRTAAKSRSGRARCTDASALEHDDTMVFKNKRFERSKEKEMYDSRHARLHGMRAMCIQ